MRNKMLALAGAAGLAVCSSLLTPTAAVAAAAPTMYYAQLKPMVANHAAGSGGIWIALTGNSAKFTLQVAGVLAGAPHAAQLWVDGRGQCPGAAQATLHNGHRTIGLADETPILGAVGAALTTSGDTSAHSALAFSRFPTAGAYTYTRTFDIAPTVAAAVKNGSAVLVVHGIDYNGNGKFDNVLGTTAGHPSLAAEETAPALCGSFVASQMLQAVPAGSADTGGGSAAATSAPIELALGALALLTGAVAAAVAFRRRTSGQSAIAGVTNGFRRMMR